MWNHIVIFCALWSHLSSFGSLSSTNDDEEELTHYGQSLSEIEKFEAPPSDSDDEDDPGKISGMVF